MRTDAQNKTRLRNLSSSSPSQPHPPPPSQRFRLRWFTPTTEVSLCGHATLATAHVLFEHMGNGSPSISFETLSGELIVSRRRGGVVVGGGEGGEGEETTTTTTTLALRFPHNPPVVRAWRKEEDPVVYELVANVSTKRAEFALVSSSLAPSSLTSPRPNRFPFPTRRAGPRRSSGAVDP